ncbi:transposase [Sharpea azabuensis]|uniref:transposase n=1 Tax=Sharpea azabuensis TaxID=322505 RepID=UPI003D04DE26
MKVTDSVVKIFNESGQLYGSPKIAALINRRGEDKVSQKYVLGIMKKLGIKPQYIRHRTNHHGIKKLLQRAEKHPPQAFQSRKA